MKLIMLPFLGLVLLFSFHCESSQAFELDNDLSSLANLLNGGYPTPNSHHQVNLKQKRGEGKQKRQNPVRHNLPPGYTELSRHNGVITAYKLNRTKVTWNEARNSCQKDGGFLGYPVNAREGKQFHHLLKQENKGGAWIGLHDLFEEGDWVTVQGKKVDDLKYTNWALTEPNNYLDNEDCAEIYDKDGQWYDTECDKKLIFICKIIVR